MAISSTSGDGQEPVSNLEVERCDGSKKVNEKCSILPVQHSSSPLPAATPEVEKKRKKRNRSPGVRVVGCRIYDSQNGKTCHQCRQKTMDVMATCKNQKNEKQCPYKYCHKCLLNRYGEKAEEVAVLEDWLCPKCKDICNCSFCRKKRGQEPTGILSHTAKSTGYSSVSEMLLVQGSDIQSEKEPTNFTSRKNGKENIFTENSNINLDEQKVKKKVKRVKVDKKAKGGELLDGTKKDEKEVNEMDDGVIVSKRRKRKSNTDMDEDDGQVKTNSISSLTEIEIPLPQGSEFKTVAGIELQHEEVGKALQFLEFCAAFEEIFDLKKDEPEYILHELIRGGPGCIGRSSPVAQFLVRLLSVIQTNWEESPPAITHRLSHQTSWMLALHKCISNSYLSEKLLDKFDGGVDSFNSLNSTERLTLVNFVCDEVLCTNKVRNWIEEQRLKSCEKTKQNKEKVAAAKQKEKLLKQKMKDELAAAIIAKNGIPLSIFEHTAIVSEIKSQVSQAHAEMLESKVMLDKEKQDCIPVRTKPIFIDNDGRIFWRLKGSGDKSDILLQETSLLPNETEFHEKWFIYEEGEQADRVKKYISFKEKEKKYSSMVQYT